MDRYMLAKVGSRQRMRELAESGTVYMPRLRTFRTISTKWKGDPREGVWSRYSSDNPTLKIVARIGDKEIPLPGASIHMEGQELDHAVYCMRGFEVTEADVARGSVQLAVADEPRFAEFFGDTLVIFHDTNEFERRLCEAAAKAGHEFWAQPVEYAPLAHCGDMGPFRKLEPFAWQSEYRFLTQKPIDEPALILNLGCLLDICGWVDLSAARVA